MAKNIEAIIEAIVGSLVCIGGSVITVAASGGHQEINPQNYVQMVMIYGGLVASAVGAAIVELGGHKFDRNNNTNYQEDKENHQDHYAD